MRKLLIIAVLVVLPLLAAGQARITGRILDESGAALEGAVVYAPGATNGTMTAPDGTFSLTVASSVKEVTASCLGYRDKTVPLTGGPLEIILEADTETIEESIVLGYGSAKKVNSLIGSVTTVSNEAIRTAPSSSALDMLQGQVAGLAVLTSGGVAGDNSVSMTLHGTGSLSASSAPLFMIDGVPSSSRTIMALNPADIESISILKDASATSIYGSRAANGVVYVITKQGAYSERATISFRSQYGISTVTSNALYENMMSGPELKKFWVASGVMSARAIRETFTQRGYDADTRWYEYVQQYNNPQYQNDISVEGGGQKVAYMIGASQFHQRGSAIGNVYDRYTLRGNVQGHPREWLKVGLNSHISIDRTVTNPNWSSSGSTSTYRSGALSYLTNPLYPAVDENGVEYPNEYPGGMINHRTYMENRKVWTDRYGLVGSVFMEVNPWKTLKFSSRLGTDAYFSFYNGQMNPSYFAMDGYGWRSRSATFNYTATLTNTAEYSFELGNDHAFTVLLGQEGISADTDSFAATAYQIEDPRLIRLGQGLKEQNAVSESRAQYRFLSFFSHIDYSLTDRYIFDASFRTDASSRFGAGNRWAPFWAVGALWKVKREAFMHGVTALDDLAFKLSYGTQGNANISNYQALALVGSGSAYNGGQSLRVTQPANEHLTWEQQALLTVALKGRAWNFLDFDLSWYHRTTSHMLMSVPFPATTGFSSMYQNVGGLLNTGIDATLAFDLLRRRDAFLKLRSTIGYNREKVTELFDGLERWEITGTGVAFVVGQPVMYYAPIYAGVDRSDGTQRWYLPAEDADGNILPDVCTTDRSRMTATFNSETLTQNTGKPLHAPLNGGLGIAGGWRNWALSVDFAYVLGKYMMNNDAFFYANPNQSADINQHKDISDFWTETNTDAVWPDWRKGAIMQVDTHLLEDASFLRLKNLLLSYSLPERVLSRQHFLTGVRLSLTGRNLLTFTKYSGIDPEDDANVALGLPANSRQFLLGLEILF